MSERPKVWTSEARELSFVDLDALVERERNEEREQEVALFGHEGVRLTVTIAASLGPIERVERIEVPLGDALGDRGIVWGGGSFMREVEGGMQIAEVDVGVSVADETEGVARIARFLAEGGWRAARVRRTGSERVLSD